MKTFTEELERLKKRDISVINNNLIKDINLITSNLLVKEICLEEEILTIKNILTISNILYNNTSIDVLPLEDGIYDLLLEKYKKYDSNFQVGSDIVYFDNIQYKSPVREINNHEDQGINMVYEIPQDDINFMNNMFFSNIINEQPRTYIDDRDIVVRHDVDITGKKYRTISHNNIELVGSLDKYKYVLNSQAIENGVFDDSNVKILERDFFEPHFKKGIIDQDTIIKMVAELKYDGISVVVIIENGIVVHAYSRGDTGNDKATDYTPIFYGYEFPRLPKNHTKLEVKCEAIISYYNLSNLNRIKGVNYKNARSAINGLLGGNDAPMYRNFITLVPLKISGEGVESPDRVTEVDFINKYLFTGEFLRASYIEGNFVSIIYQINKFVEEAERVRPYIPFMYDGVVVSYIDEDIINALGRENFINKYSAAIKFNALVKSTRLLYIDYSIGQDGTITPIAHYNPIEFLGTIHTKASISSLGRFNSLQLRENDTIEVEYTNDVIPYVKSVVSHESNSPTIGFPIECPCCGSILEISSTAKSAKCPNIRCTERSIKRVANMMDKLGIKDFGEETMRVLNIFSFSNMIYKTKEEVSYIGDANSTKFEQAMMMLRTESKYDYIIVGALGFSNVGKETWKKILFNYDIPELLDIIESGPESLYNSLINIKGIGKLIIKTICDEMDYFYKDLVTISLMNNIVSTKNKKSIKVRFTGVRDQKLIEYLNSNGYDAGEGSVTKDTDILIVPNADYNSGKVTKAKGYGIEIIPIQDFRSKLEL